MTDPATLDPRDTRVIIRNTILEDIPKIVDLQQVSFPFLARYGNTWHPEELENHLRIFSQGQFVAVSRISPWLVLRAPLLFLLSLTMLNIHGRKSHQMAYLQTTILMATAYMELSISTHPKYRHEGIGKMLYDARKDLVTKLNLRRMIAGGRLFKYCEYANKMSALEYAQRVIKKEFRDPVLSFELDNGFKFIKILPNYLDDVRSLNYASFIEWLNPR